MRFDEVRARLSHVPDRLPLAPAELMPVVLATADGSPPGLPRFPDGPRRPAAVLILIHPDAAGEACLVLTERSSGEHRHAGQISLPGGAIDEDDDGPVAAALREAAEEVGLDVVQAGVTIAGVLPVVDVRVSGFLVHPVVAFAQRPPMLTPDGYETAAVLTAPIATFLPGAPIETVTDERDGFRLRYGGYRVSGHLVWGATAGMLGSLGAYLGGVRQAPGA
jgi:8-oxo-dGTP pyrophosphatase MutT (NUDIX family)